MASTKYQEEGSHNHTSSAQPPNTKEPPTAHRSTKKIKKDKVKKPKSPFRIRIGSLVALRSPLSIPDNWLAVWTPAPPGTPLDWTLVGKTIRCTDPSTQIHIEGLVVRVVDRETIELLIPKKNSGGGKQLRIVHYDFATAREQALQLRIQGPDKVVVEISGLKKFVVRAYVPPKRWEDATLLQEPTERKKTINTNRVLHVGDSNDSNQQQVENWRWLASRCRPRAWPEIAQVVGIDQSPAATTSSVAHVVLRRCLWPEQTKNGRQPFHKPSTVYADADMPSTIQVPIENVVQVARKVVETSDATTDSVTATVQYKYSLQNNIYYPLDAVVLNTTEPHCHRCRHQLDPSQLQQCTTCRRNWWCKSCHDHDRSQMQQTRTTSTSQSMRCCTDGDDKCDCVICQAVADADLEKEWDDCLAYNNTQDASIQTIMERISTRVPFGLPPGFLGPWPMPQTQPSAKLVYPKKNGGGRRLTPEPTKRKRQRSPTPDTRKTTIDVPEDYSTFRPTCARTSIFECKARHPSLSIPTDERPRNIRDSQVSRLLTAAPGSASHPSHRAVRANQRRNRQASNFLLSTQPQVRFGRSRIHAWGVFADQPIPADELIVEYRGELVGNAVAERRHEEYTRELGSDYMFRIDGNVVCDATKLGNVARFINASCDPNCYTKIISAEGSKRIVIYAKRDIDAGEELSYDYKFELEYDPTKRIVCRCGAKDCRGFMNWDRKYVAITPSDSS